MSSRAASSLSTTPQRAHPGARKMAQPVCDRRALPPRREVNHPLTELKQVINQSKSPPKRGTVSSLVRQRHSLMFSAAVLHGFRHYAATAYRGLAFRDDASLGSSEGFFAGQHVALDLSAVNLSSSAIGQLVANLEERNVRVLGIEGVDPAKWQAGLPRPSRRPRLANVRGAGVHRPRHPDFGGR